MKVAVVTGGSSGIGAALARALATRGWLCILVARRRERLERLAGRLGGEAEPCDVGDRVAVERVAQRVAERHQAVQLLVNNAGIPGRKSFLELEPERIEELVRTNYLGGIWCLRAFLPLLEAGAPANVVNVASVAGTTAYGSSGPYSASKHAQLAFSRGVATELAPRGIRVLTVIPGPVQTEGFPQERLIRHPAAKHAVLSPEQVAEAILRALERSAPELTVPAPLRVVGAVQGLIPGTLARAMARRARSR